MLAQAFRKDFSTFAFVFAQCLQIPLWIIHSFRSHKSGLPAHGQADICCLQAVIDNLSKHHDFFPLALGIGFGDPGCFRQAGDLIGKMKGNLTFSGGTADRRGTLVVRRTGQGDMPFTGKQTGSWIHTNPACSGDVHFHPGVQVSEILGGAGGTFEGRLIGHQLNQISGNKAGSQTQMS